MRTNISLGGVTLESLEQRKLMTAGQTIQVFHPAATKLRDGTLYIKGTQFDDNITASLAISPTVTATPLLEISLSTRTGTGADSTLFFYDSSTGNVAGPTFVLADVKKIIVDAGSGNDKVDLSALDIPSVIYGGAGNDTLLGTAANDTIYGDNGNDAITDGAGNDLLVGGNGNDILRAHKGIDTLLGQSGIDYFYTFSSGDFLNGGASTSGAYVAGAPAELKGSFGFITGSPYILNPSSVNDGAELQLYRNSEGELAVDAQITLGSGGWAVNWTLEKNTTGDIVVDANLYAATIGSSTAALTTYRHTFVLSKNFSVRPVKVALRQSGTLLLSGRTFVTPSFDNFLLATSVDSGSTLTPA